MTKWGWTKWSYGPCHRKGEWPWTTIAHPALPATAIAADVVAKEPRLSAATSVGTRIDIVSDTICPWCYIGKRHLEHALATLAEEGLTFQVHWNPFQLNPDMPREGRDRASYRAWKFGSASKAAALDKRITEAAANIETGVPHRPHDPHPEHD